MLACDFEDVLPILRYDLGMRIVLGDGDAEHAMPGRHVEHLQLLRALHVQQTGGQFGSHCLQLGHRLREADPNLVLRAKSILLEYCSTLADRAGDVVKAFELLGVKQESKRATEVCRRMAIEE